MRVTVLGAGVVGVMTAYYLAEAGYEVTVLDQAQGPAQGASGDNGGQLSWSFVDALASPSFLRKIPALLLGKDQATRLRPGFSPAALAWTLAFVRHCTRRREQANTRAVLKLATHSCELMNDLAARLPVDFSFRKAGKLVLLNSDKAVTEARRSVTLKQSEGLQTQLLDFDQACLREPSLAQFRGHYQGAVWSAGDQVGDTRAFTTGLAGWLESERGVRFRFGSKAQRLEARKGRLCAIVCNGEELETRTAVVCLGAQSPKLLGPAGVRVNIAPVKGYSVTLPPGNSPNQVSITHQSGKFVFSRLNGAVRIAGFADLVGFDARNDALRVAQLVQAARKVAPEVAAWSAGERSDWAGYRPMTADSRPIVGSTPIRGLYLNTGHGMLGWTLAAATAKSVSEQLGANPR